MKVRTRTLAKLDRGYSIAVVPGRAGPLPAFVAGSEGEGELLHFEGEELRPRILARAPGGYISTASVIYGGKRHLVASTLFKPGFNAAQCVLQLYPLEQDESPASIEIASLPYTHRVATFEKEGRSYILASTLCAAKSATDDWSQPGGIHLIAVPPAGEPWPAPRMIFPGLNKNHGFDAATLHGREGHLVSAMEGLFFLPIPANPEGEWNHELIVQGEHSDAFAFDWDGDGKKEIFSISPFHGNVLAMHRQSEGGWVTEVIHDDLELGHIVWAGDFLGRPGLLGGSRRGRRELRLYRPTESGGVDRAYEVLDEGVGPSQIAVIPGDAQKIALYMAAHGQNEIRVYEFEN